MTYPLQSMLKIREMREDRASHDLTVARTAKRVAEEERNRRQAELDAYNETKDERRDRIFEAVMGRLVTKTELDITRDAVTSIDEEGFLLDEARCKAQQLVEKKTSEAESAKIKYVAAMKNKLKIAEHKSIWQAEDLKEQERLQDAEMEEFTGKKMDLED